MLKLAEQQFKMILRVQKKSVSMTFQTVKPPFLLHAATRGTDTIHTSDANSIKFTKLRFLAIRNKGNRYKKSFSRVSKIRNLYFKCKSIIEKSTREIQF